MKEVVHCSSIEEFQYKLSECEDRLQNRPLFVLFTGSKNDSTGKSWCPDCTAAEPVIDSVLNSLESGYMLLVCSVDREPYRTADYAYRTNPAIKLTCVPTLMKWKNGKAVARLNDSQSQVAEFVQDLVDA